MAKKYDGTAKRSRGRPRKRDEIADLVLEMADENQSWGYTRIRDALHNLGITVDRNTVKRILNDHGIEPAPERKRTGTPWKSFLAVHWGALATIDFFNVEVLTFTGITRYHVLFAMRLETREVQILGITDQPCESWTKQMARNLSDPVEGFLRDTCCTTPDISSWTGIRFLPLASGTCSRRAARNQCDYLREAPI